MDFFVRIIAPPIQFYDVAAVTSLEDILAVRDPRSQSRTSGRNGEGARNERSGNQPLSQRT